MKLLKVLWLYLTAGFGNKKYMDRHRVTPERVNAVTLISHEGRVVTQREWPGEPLSTPERTVFWVDLTDGRHKFDCTLVSVLNGDALYKIDKEMAW